MKIDIRRCLEWVRGSLIVVLPYRLSSYTMRLGGGKESSGFMGLVGYVSTAPGSHEHCATGMLARFSEFAGTGVGRRLGFGVTSFREGGMVGEGGRSS